MTLQIIFLIRSLTASKTAAACRITRCSRGVPLACSRRAVPGSILRNCHSSSLPNQAIDRDDNGCAATSTVPLVGLCIIPLSESPMRYFWVLPGIAGAAGWRTSEQGVPRRPQLVVLDDLRGLHDDVVPALALRRRTRAPLTGASYRKNTGACNSCQQHRNPPTQPMRLAAPGATAEQQKAAKHPH